MKKLLRATTNFVKNHPLINHTLAKVVTYNKRPKMKRDTGQKISPFLRKRLLFLSGISLHFWLYIIRYGFSITPHKVAGWFKPSKWVKFIKNHYEHFFIKLAIVVWLLDRNRSNRANDVPTPQATNVMQQRETMVERWWKFGKKKLCKNPRYLVRVFLCK